MTYTYLNKEQREKLIDQCVYCRADTEGYLGVDRFLGEGAPEEQGEKMRAWLRTLNNSQLAAEIDSSGLGIF